MGAGRAHLGCRQTLMQVPAIAAAPDDTLLAPEDPVGFDVAGQLDVPFLMLLFGVTDCLSRTDVSSGAVVLSTGLDMNRYICTDDTLADLFLYVVSNIVCFFNRKVLAHG